MSRRPRIIVDGIELDRREAEEVFRRAQHLARTGRGARFVAAAAMLGVIFSIPMLYFAYTFNASRAWLLMPAFVIYGALMGVSLGLLLRLSFFFLYRREIRAAMNELGYALCPGCGYWLRGLEGRAPRCPECGETVPPDTAPETDAESDHRRRI